MAISHSPAVRLIDGGEPVAKPALHDVYDFTLRDRWRSGRSGFVIADGLAIVLVVDPRSSATRTFAIVAFVLCATWARVGDHIAVSGLDRAGRVVASIAIAHLCAELVAGSTVPLSSALVVLFAVLVARSVAACVLRVLRAHRVLGERVLVLGGDEEIIVEVMHAHRELGMRPVTVGALEADPTLVGLDNAERLDAVLREHRVHRVFVDLDVLTWHVWSEISSRVELCCVMSNPRGVPVVHRIDDHLWGLPVARVWCRADARPLWRMKRPLDIAMASLGIILTAPLALIAYPRRARVESRAGVAAAAASRASGKNHPHHQVPHHAPCRRAGGDRPHR